MQRIFVMILRHFFQVYIHAGIVKFKYNSSISSINLRQNEELPIMDVNLNYGCRPFLESGFGKSILQRSSGKYFNLFGHSTSVIADLRKVTELIFFHAFFYLQI